MNRYLPQNRRTENETWIRVVFQLIFVYMLTGILVSSCSTADHGPDCEPNIPCIPADQPYEQLSEYRFYGNNLSALEPADGLLPYDLSTPLYSDYSRKLRFVYLPGNTSAPYREEGVLDFPIGSVLIKNFFYKKDRRDPSSGRTLIETRLLIRQSDRWMAATYVWNEQQTEAFLQETGDSKEVEWIDREGRLRKVNYLIPTRNDCKTCHSRGNTLTPIGPKVRNLNKVFQYDDGEENQLVRWQRKGMLYNVPEMGAIPRVPVWDDPETGPLGERARIYLDVNCAHCHNRSGSANNSGLFLTFDEPDPFRLGICKKPVAAGAGSGSLDYDIAPGQPEQSVLLYRMKSIEPATRMPEIGRTLVHEEAVELIREWIEKMELDPCK